MSSGESPELLRRGLLVGGREVPAASGGTLTAMSPATGGPSPWGGLRHPSGRRRCLPRGSRGVRCRDVARPPAGTAGASASPARRRDRTETRGSLRPGERQQRAPYPGDPGIGITGARGFRYNAALLLADRSDLIPIAGPYHSYTTRFPLGVVAILSSFNHPLMIGSKSLAPA
jgi:hypothetical protein